MIPDSCLEIHTSPVDRPSVPPSFAEVAIVAGYLAKKELLDAFSHQVRLLCGRFGSYEPLDFRARLFGYARSFERMLSDFFHRLAPFGAASPSLSRPAGLSRATPRTLPPPSAARRSPGGVLLTPNRPR